MERALQVYNGKALINSVNGKAEVMDEIFRWWPDTAAQW